MQKVILQAVAIAAISSWIALLAAQFWPLRATVEAGVVEEARVVRAPRAADRDARPEPDAAPAQEEAVWPPFPGTVMINVATAKLAWNEGYAEIVDSRTRKEFDRARIPAAWHVPQSAFTDGNVPADFIEFVARDTPLIIYCEGGDCDTSENVAIRLQQDYRYQAIFVLKPGIPGWVEAGHPLEGDDVDGFIAELEEAGI